MIYIYIYIYKVIYIYIYIYKVTKKNRTHIFLIEIHKFYSSLFYFSGYEVDSVHEKLGPLYSPTCPEVQVYKIRIILPCFCRSNIFFFYHPVYIYIYIYVCIFWQHFLTDTYLIEYSRHFFAYHFFVNPFE